MASDSTAGKSVISQTLDILRDSFKDLWPLLRDDGAFYLPATAATVTMYYLTRKITFDAIYLPHGSKLPPLLSILGLFLAFCAVSILWNGVAATRAARRLGVLSSSRTRAITQYCLVNLTLAAYAASVGFVLGLIFAVVFLAMIYPNGTTTVSRPHYGLLLDAVLTVLLIAFQAKWGAAATVRILNGTKRPIRMSWSLTNRFWQQSVALAGALTIISWAPYWLIPGSLAFTTYWFVTLPYSFIVSTFSARAYIQFTRQMLDTSEHSSAEAPTS